MVGLQRRQPPKSEATGPKPRPTLPYIILSKPAIPIPNLTLPFLTKALPHQTLPYIILSKKALHQQTLVHLTLPKPVLSYQTLLHLTLPKLALPTPNYPSIRSQPLLHVGYPWILNSECRISQDIKFCTKTRTFSHSFYF